jgi:RNA polymerase sigma-70 factor (family 1)
MWEKRGFKVLSDEEFAEIYRAFWRKLYGMGYNYVRDKTIAQELVQDVFVKLWIKRKEVTQIEDVEAYLFRCLKNKIYDHFDSVACKLKLSKHALKNFSEEQHAVDETVAFNEAMSVISEELEKMPEKTRVIFRMSKFGRYTNNEIASEMQLSAKAVEYHITQAVKKLRIRLSVFLS